MRRFTRFVSASRRYAARCRLAHEALGEAYSRENGFYRDAARTISEARDAQAVLETLEGLKGVYSDQLAKNMTKPVREALEARRDAVAERLDLDARLEEVAALARQGRERIEGLSLERDGFGALAEGLARTYGRGRDARKAAYEADSVQHFHEWRKRAKYHRYHLKILRCCWPEMLEPHHNEVHRLTDLLGEDHDLAVLQEALEAVAPEVEDPRAIQALLGLVDRRSQELRAQARPVGRRLYGEEPRALVRRTRAYWRAWREEGEMDEVIV